MSAGRIVWLRPDDPPELFPEPASALDEPNGLLAAGGDLGEARLLAAYVRGVFPWYDEGQPILWWSPDPRCILRPADLRVTRRLEQYARRSRLELRFNSSFAAVIDACAGPRRAGSGTWITPEMQAAFASLHDRGWAHSIEVWDERQLVGGLYGLCIGQVFFGESMFSAAPNASKFAMLGLCAIMLKSGLELLDCQVVSGHLLTMGATTMPRAEFCGLLGRLCQPGLPFNGWPEDRVPVADTLLDWQRAALQ